MHRALLITLLVALAAACSLVIDDPAPFPVPEPEDAEVDEPDAGGPSIDFNVVDAAVS